MGVTLVLPVKNEISGLKVYLKDFVQSNKYDQILIIDGGSTDSSIEYCQSHGCEVISQDGYGLRNGFLKAYPFFREENIVVFSCDGNSLPAAIDPIVSKLNEGYEMVIASRYKDGAKSYDDTFLTGIANYAFTKTISLFGYRYTDAMVMFRGYKRYVPNQLGLDISRGESYENHAGRYVSWEPLMSIRAAKAKLKIAELGFDEPKRVDQSGAGSILPATRIHHYKAGIYCLLQVFEELLFWKWKRK
jgi:glycosyltransferase involved in cell wall biosynthesis